MLVVTTDGLPGREIVEVLGMVRGSTVRAKHIGSDIVAGLRNIVGGEVKEYAALLAGAREQAHDRMVEEAVRLDPEFAAGIHVWRDYFAAPEDCCAEGLAFVKQGMGVAMIDPFTVTFDDESGYQTRPFRPAVMLDLAIITAKGRPLSTIAQDFLAQLTPSIASYATHSETGAAAS